MIMTMILFATVILLAHNCIGTAIALQADSQASASVDPVVHTEYGPVRGNRDLDGFTTFHNVQFAEDPLKDLRWKPPQPPAPWTSVRVAREPGPQCPQLDVVKGIMIGKEDCLRLSVYVPKECTPSSPCPVMQWIYGGAWLLGSNEEFGFYDGTKLAEKHGVVVVAANYRLDSLGWMALQEFEDEDPDQSYGNYGLKDQRFALNWTQRNIISFGGDPNAVTIFGESAGGFSVCQHVGSPASSGLFSHAIMESGDCDGPMLLVDGADAKDFGDRYATWVGCPSNLTATQRRGCLREKEAKDILEPYLTWFCPVPRPDDPWCNRTEARQIWSAIAGRGPQNVLANIDTGKWPVPRPPFAPICGWTALVDGSDKGLPNTPIRTIEAGRVSVSPKGEPITMIMGTNNDEMALFMIGLGIVIPGIKLPIEEMDFDLLIRHVQIYHDNWNTTEVSNRIYASYPAANYKNPSSRAIDGCTDCIFRCGNRRSAVALSRMGIDVFLYNFNYHFPLYQDPSSELCQLTSEVLCGVYHASELKFVWQLDYNVQGPKEKKVMDAFSTYWTNMAKYGSPNSPSGNGHFIAWPKYNETTDMHLEFKDMPEIGVHFHKDACDMWDSLPPQGPYPSANIH